MTDPSRVRISGALQPFAAGFATKLAREGYAPRSLLYQLHLLAHVSRWLTAEDLDLSDLAIRAPRFLSARHAAGYTHHLTGRALRPMLTYLRDLGAISPTPPPIPTGPVERALARYRHYLTSSEAWGKQPPAATSMPSVRSCAVDSRPTASIWTSTSYARLT